MCWVPARWVRSSQVCDFCWERIPAGKPGARTGERGTKAYWNPERRVWECIPCRDDATRAQLAREALTRSQRIT